MEIIKFTVSVFFVIACIFACSACGAKSGTAPLETTKATTEVTQQAAGVTEERPPDETEASSVTTTVPAVRDSFALYESTIKNYGKKRIEDAANMGYTIGTPIYEYAIKDINADGSDELVIHEKVVYADGTAAEEFNLSAVYTLDGEKPVELYFISRHGNCFITSDGYLVSFYRSAELEKIVGNELVLIAESERLESDEFEEEMDAFLKANGASTDEMEFDFILYQV